MQEGPKINDTWFLKKQAKKVFLVCLFLGHSEIFFEISISSSSALAKICLYFLKKHVLSISSVLSPM